MEAQNKKVGRSRALGGMVKKGSWIAVAGIVLGASASYALELGPSACSVTVSSLQYATGGMTSGTKPQPILAEYDWEQNRPDSNAPILVFVHGGGWTGGTPRDPWFYDRHRKAQEILRNFNIVSVDYRKFAITTAKNPYPAQRDDIVKFIQGIDTPQNRICLMGHSAGAHIAATVAAKLGSSVVNCLVGIAGPYDLSEQALVAQENKNGDTDYSKWGVGAIKNARAYRDSAIESATVSPAWSLPASYNVPTLLFHGARDVMVDKDQTTTYLQNIDVLTLASVAQVPSIFPNDSHTPWYFGNCSNHDSSLPADATAIVQFLRQHMPN